MRQFRDQGLGVVAQRRHEMEIKDFRIACGEFIGVSDMDKEELVKPGVALVPPGIPYAEGMYVARAWGGSMEPSVLCPKSCNMAQAEQRLEAHQVQVLLVHSAIRWFRSTHVASGEIIPKEQKKKLAFRSYLWQTAAIERWQSSGNIADGSSAPPTSNQSGD
jgi:hypothetical protein